MLRITTSLVTSAVIASSTLVAPSAIATPAAVAAEVVGCQQVLLVGARGAGQSLAKADEHMALNTILQRNLGGIRYGSVQVGDTATPPNLLDPGGYPANGMNDWFGVGAVRLKLTANLLRPVAVDVDQALMGPYYDSMNRGRSNLIDWLPNRARACPGEIYVLDGYSQGAHALGQAFRDLPADVRSRVEFVAFFGDPVATFGPWNRGSAALPGGALGARLNYLPGDLARRTGLWCDVYDGICNTKEALVRATDDLLKEAVHTVWLFDRRGLDLGRLEDALLQAHFDYDEANQEVTRAANEITERLRARFPSWDGRLTTTPIPLTGRPATKVDVAFVVDTTGSMWDDLDAAKASASQISAKVLGLPNARVKLVEYRDAGDAFRARTVTPFTGNAARFASGLSWLVADGGGDWPESVHSGMMEAFKGDWRPGALKMTILIGDAPAHDPEPGTGYTSLMVQRRAFALDPVVVNPVVVGSDSETMADFAELADASGGDVYSAADAGELTTAIRDSITGFERSPVASLRGPYPTAPNEYLQVATGQTVAFSAADSLDPDSAIKTYAWDFDGDGRAEKSGPLNTVRHRFTSPYKGLVSVTVTSFDGGTNTATLPVWASSSVRAKAAPAAPRSVTLRRNRGKATLTWTPPAATGGDVISGYVVARNGTPIALVPAEAPRRVRIAWPRSKPLRMSAAAVNGVGLGPANAAFVRGLRKGRVKVVVARRDLLKIDVNPNNRRANYRLAVLKAKNGRWRTWKRAVTRGPADRVRLDPPRGRYKVVVKATRTTRRMTSRVVRVAR